jgi:hypothetical protein
MASPNPLAGQHKHIVSNSQRFWKYSEVAGAK